MFVRTHLNIFSLSKCKVEDKKKKKEILSSHKTRTPFSFPAKSKHYAHRMNMMQ